MTILKKLIYKEWFKALFASIFVLFLLVSLSNIISEVLRAVAPMSDILKNYLLEMPKWFNRILPISCLVAGLFSLSKLQNRGELMAIFSIGFPRNTFLITIFNASLVVATFQFLIAGHLKPFAKASRATLMAGQEIHFRSNKSKGVKTSSLTSGKIWYKSKDYFSGFSAYDKQNQEFKEIDLFYFNETNKITKIISAEKAKFENGHWTFYRGREQNKLSDKTFPTLSTFQFKKVPLLENPQNFDRINSDIEQLNIFDLYLYIKKIEKLGINSDEFKVYFYQIIADSLVCIAFSFMAISAIFTPNRRHASFAKNIFFTFTFTLLYWLLYTSLIQYGVSGKVPPAVASLSIPALCFIFLILRFYKYQVLR